MSLSDRERLFKRVYAVVAAVPQGTVATYGQIAEQAGVGPRNVGQALSALPPGSDCPWHRVINAQGRVSIRPHRHAAVRTQKRRLEKEGILFQDGKVDLNVFRWHPRV